MKSNKQRANTKKFSKAILSNITLLRYKDQVIFAYYIKANYFCKLI